MQTRVGPVRPDVPRDRAATFEPVLAPKRAGRVSRGLDDMIISLAKAAAGARCPLPVIEGTAIRLRVDTLPNGGAIKPVWLWWSGTDATTAEVDRCRQSFLRCFDIEHTFRMLKQTLGWTRPRLRTPHAADRWTWLVIAAHTQLRLARPLAIDLRRPWESQPNQAG